MPAWKKSGALLISEVPYINSLNEQDASYVLIDLRDAATAANGFIPGAVSIPADKLAASQALFPADKKAPIILYADGVDVDSFKTVRGWGYVNVTVLGGGIAAWQGEKGMGALATAITYVKKTPKGQISIDEFKDIVKNKPADKVILDVREAETQAAGSIPGALLIPNGDLEARIGELPKDKEIIIHCNTGILAANAARMLKEKGYNVRYLNAIIQVAKDGSFEITEK